MDEMRLLTFRRIQEMPTCVDEIPAGCRGVHESTLRAYQVLRKVEGWLRVGVPAAVILELIAELQDNSEKP